MEISPRAIAILVEVSILTLLAGTLLTGAWLTIFDLGLRPKYRQAVTMALVVIGGLALVFFIVHLTSFYPTP